MNTETDQKEFKIYIEHKVGRNLPVYEVHKRVEREREGFWFVNVERKIYIAVLINPEEVLVLLFSVKFPVTGSDWLKKHPIQCCQYQIFLKLEITIFFFGVRI